MEEEIVEETVEGFAGGREVPLEVEAEEAEVSYAFCNWINAHTGICHDWGKNHS